MKLNKLLCLSACALLAGCGTSASASSNAIHVISREDGSGTQGAFTELFDIENQVADAEITNSTSIMIETVKGDTDAIGYISLGSLNDSVKAVDIDGVAASADTVSDGTYPVKRPFLIVTGEDASDAALDFADFILSEEGQDIVNENGYVAVEATATWTASDMEGTVSVGGSSSVTPLMEKLAEAYQSENTGVKILVQQSDSSTGISSTADGTYDIGMASRDMKEAEKELGLSETVMAWDGIAVIVNTENSVSSLTKEQVKEIYEGSITSWNDIQD